MKEINANLQAVAPGVSVIPWAMIPWSVWSSPAQRLLAVACNSYPPELWNCFLMPADEKSATALSMPMHPRCEIPGVAETCIRLLVELSEEHQAISDRAGAALARGDWESFFNAIQNSEEKYKARILMLAHAITEDLFGKPVYERHKELFGRNLGWC
jgi:hypothetical protein